MKNTLNYFAAFAAGAVAMYYFDTRMGRRRRALVRDKVVAAGHGTADLLEAKGKRLFDQAKGVAATGRLGRVSTSEPLTDQQLCERIRSRLGHLIGQPKAITVEAQGGQVKLSGHILAHEVDKVLNEVSSMAGVESVHNALVQHQHAGEIADWLSRQGIPRPQPATQGS